MASKQKPEDFGLKSKKNRDSLSLQSNSSLKSNGNQGKAPASASDRTTVRVTSSSAETSPSTPSKTMTTKSPVKNRWWQTWQFWGIILVFCSGGIGYTATSMLLKLPKTQSCSKVFWPVASASVRLYCAQTFAEEKTVGSLLQAIALVEELPQQHPLRNEINRNVEKWAKGILEIGETKFQEGNLEAAVAIAKQIPENVKARKVVESQVNSWQEIWNEGANNYAQVEDNLRKAQWSSAFSWAVKLTDSKNDYWATTKYSEAIDNINIAQEESITLDKAANQLNDRDIESLLDAINKAKDIPSDSYTYDNAQTILAQGKEKLLVRIDNLIQQQKWPELLRVTHRIPDVLNLEPQVKDWKIIASAGSSAALDTVLGLEDAIAEAGKLEPDSPFYDKGQKLIERWKLEIYDVQHLARAKELARPGTITAYNAAITEVNFIPRNNPRYADAQKQIGKWRREIQIIEDRPIIQRARELALPGNATAWQRAIAEIKLVSSSSPLYSEAQKHARDWQTSIEREEDRPILNEAISLGNAGDYNEAIATAQQIASGRALSAEAQRKIALWRKEIQAEKYLADAKYLARQNSSDSLARAIRVIRQIDSSTSLYYEVVPNVNTWSQEILNIAERSSYRSLEEGIAIAKKVPSGTIAHPSAQSLIERWQNQLNPPPLIQKQEKSNSGFQLEKQKKE